MARESGEGRPESGIACEEALRVLAEARGERHLVISNQMSARLWPLYSQHPLDFNYLSSTMGGAVPLGLGLALARPDLEVVVLSGDGSLLMNLGCLVSVTASGAKNLTVIVLNNGLYEVTGGQRTPGHLASVDFGQVARAAGFPLVREFGDLASWQAEVSRCWDSGGPRLMVLRVDPVQPATARCTTTRVDAELQRLRETLAHTPPS